MWRRERRRLHPVSPQRRLYMRDYTRRRRAEERAIRDAEIARSLAEWTAPDVRLTDTPMPYEPKAVRDRRIANGTASRADWDAKIAELEARLARIMSPATPASVVSIADDAPVNGTVDAGADDTSGPRAKADWSKNSSWRRDDGRPS
jgi:hypothetical protein